MTPFYRDETLRIAVERGLCVARWQAPPEVGQFAHLLEGVRAAARETGQAALLNVVDSDRQPRFDDAMRTEGARLMRETSGLTAATAHVVLMGGFAGAAVRMFLSTMMLLARGGSPTSVHPTVAAAAAWLAERAPEAWTAARVEAVYAQLAT